MKRGDRVIEIKTGTLYIVFDVCEDEICILQTFTYEPYPYKRQVKIWQPKERFVNAPDEL